jgi:hypothetical protein
MIMRVKRRYYVAVVIFIFGFIFLGITFFRYVPPLLLKTAVKTLKTPSAQPEEIFRQYVLSPIPKSVKNIKADQPGKIFGYTYTFRFNISRDDLALLLDSQPFIEVRNVNYKNGMLEWGWGRIDQTEPNIPKYGISLPLYEYGDRPHDPSWFRPGQWNNPEAYGFYKVGDLVNTQAIEQDAQDLGGRETIQVLLYNEEEEEAYFIVSDRENR